MIDRLRIAKHEVRGGLRPMDFDSADAHEEWGLAADALTELAEAELCIARLTMALSCYEPTSSLVLTGGKS
jgi:hypothetical protein